MTLSKRLDIQPQSSYVTLEADSQSSDKNCINQLRDTFYGISTSSDSKSEKLLRDVPEINFSYDDDFIESDIDGNSVFIHAFDFYSDDDDCNLTDECTVLEENICFRQKTHSNSC